MVRRWCSFLAVVSVGEVLLRRSLFVLLSLSIASDYYTYVMMVPLVTVCLIYSERKSIFANTSYCPRAAAILVPLGIIMVVLNRMQIVGLPRAALALTISVSVAFVISAFVLCFGKAACRAALFPLAFLALMVPLPGFVIDRIILLLQTGSTVVTCWIFQLLHIAVSRQGFILSLPDLTIEVARECSSIRSSTALVIAAVLAGHLFLRSPWTRIALVIAALPIAVVKNAIRISTLSILELYVYPGVFQSPLHHEGGIVFFLMALAVLMLLLHWLRSSEAHRKP